ncbi:sigma-54 interaction domain-containing protein [Desulfoluna butyratoxydans]|uniref:HTH-type transcriptional regulatory protein TyrR n=1 Tax=Desulfoluna butyratoxydans TaxID=231438 RepID=A0A4U8YHQ3_9BACT|nr:sigma 54-interacting transcriptional regulator [Desulfoluna butyratoxydans]VFQ43091.1 rna polymerase sigma factor 54 interaction domain [Desulfoluna butyratoxydans]
MEKSDHFGLSFSTFARLIDNLHDEIIIYDRSFRIVYINKACIRHYGYTQEEMIGQTIWDFIDDGDTCWNLSTLPYVCELNQPLRQKQKTYIGSDIHTIAIPLHDDTGAIDYVVMSVRDDIEQSDINRLVDVLNIVENPPERYEKGLIYRSEAMRSVVQLAQQVASLNAPCLILGESGCGKSLIAQYIHNHGDRRDAPFVNINCASIQASLFESELFGHKKGAFTGADTDKEGLIAKAEGGTLFLDEISELPFPLQAKLLHVVQEREYRKVGSPHPQKADVRILTATNRNLPEMVKNKAFREDLYYRLNVFEMVLPPLRTRSEDIAPLTYHFLNEFGKRHNREKRISEAALQVMKSCPWRGNVRELAHTIERLVVTVDEGVIDTAHLPRHLYRIVPATSLDNTWGTLDEAVEALEKRIVSDAFKKEKSSRKVAQALGISQTRASRLIRKHLG